jgi:pSer/pThr/pTyr-binding forkhead associated (FHA) protein
VAGIASGFPEAVETGSADLHDIQMIRLLVKFKDKTIREIAFDRIDRLSIGRKPNHHLVLDNYAVSGDHALIIREGHRFIVKDTNSRNGTFLNGLTVQQAHLKNGDIITIGKHSLVFLERGRPQQKREHEGLKTASLPGDLGPDHTMFMDTDVYRRMLTESGDIPEILESPACISFLAGGDGKIGLEKSRVTIGRSRRCDIVISGFFSFLAGDPAATISKTTTDHYISGAGGWIKPKVNDRVVRRPVKLKDMDIIRIGATVLQYASSDRN